MKAKTVLCTFSLGPESVSWVWNWQILMELNMAETPQNILKSLQAKQVVLEMKYLSLFGAHTFQWGVARGKIRGREFWIFGIHNKTSFVCAVRQRHHVHLLWSGAPSYEGAQPGPPATHISSCQRLRPLPWPSGFHQWPQRAEDRPQPHFGRWLSCFGAASLAVPERAELVQQQWKRRAAASTSLPPVDSCQESLPLLCQPTSWGRVRSQSSILFLVPGLQPWQLLPWVQPDGGAGPAAPPKQHLLWLQHGQPHSHRLGGEDAHRSDQPELLINRNWST